MIEYLEDSTDFVFAYRLRKVSCKKGDVVTDEEFNKGALFDLDNKETTNAAEQAVQFMVEEEDTGAKLNMDLDSFSILDEDDGEACI